MYIVLAGSYLRCWFIWMNFLYELVVLNLEVLLQLNCCAVHQSARKSGVILEGDDELREKLEKEVVGDMAPQVKHHLTREQVERRKEEIELAATLRESEAKSRMGAEEQGEDGAPLNNTGEDQV